MDLEKECKLQEEEKFWQEEERKGERNLLCKKHNSKFFCKKNEKSMTMGTAVRYNE